MVREVRNRLGDSVYGEAAQTMEGVVGQALAARGLTVAVAESCTGGLIGHRITQVPGSSSYFDRSVICYSDEAKQELLGVPEALIRDHGAVSAEVAAAMAGGIRVRSRTDIGLSVTGIAGPRGGTKRKPVGLVCVGLDSGVTPTRRETRQFHFHGDRHMIKLRASQAALNVLRLYLAELDHEARR
jgi:nicotinamide-nucleotide amidase